MSLLTIPAAFALCLIFLRLLGLPSLFKVPLSLEQTDTTGPVAPRELVFVLIWAVFIRLFAYLISLFSVQLFSIGSIDQLPRLWANWDGLHYLQLAEKGYLGYLEGNEPIFLVFFPLYPWLIRALHLLIPDYYLCAYLLSNLCFAGGCCFFYLLLAKETTKRTAFRGVILLSLFPFSFFFGAVRTESLFLLTTAAALYYIRRHHFFAASIWGALASMTRMHGFLLVFAAAAEIITAYHPFTLLKNKDWSSFFHLFWEKIIFLFPMIFGTLVYLLLNIYVSGNPFQFLIYQKEHWYQGLTFFTNTIRIISEQIFPVEDPARSFVLFLPQLILFFFALVILLYGIRRIPVTYSVYFFVYLFMTYSITWPLSCGRYMTCALPMFYVLALMSKKHSLGYHLLLAGSAAFFILFIPLFLMNIHLY